MMNDPTMVELYNKENDNTLTKRMTNILRCILQEVCPETGEVIDVGALKSDEEFQYFLSGLYEKYHVNRIEWQYIDFEKRFPEHAIIMKENYFYSAHNKSALVMNYVLGYKIRKDKYNRLSTGGPDYIKISNALRGENISFILVDKGRIVDQFDGMNPFSKYGIDDDTYIMKDLGDVKSAIESSNVEYEPTDPVKKSKKYPDNLLKAILPEQIEYPSDIENRITAVLNSTKVFSQYYRRDVECIQGYYEKGKTLAELGTYYGITRERIRQLNARALKRMRRANIVAYLKGETDTFIDNSSVKKRRIKNTDVSIPENPDLYTDFQIASNDSLSISKLALVLSNRAEEMDGNKLSYADITSWLIEKGDLLEYKVDGKTIIEPTKQGKRNGITKGKRLNSKGIEYVGVYLEKDAQVYIVSHLEEIIEYKARNKNNTITITEE